jgi:hypothetical protein
MSAVRHQLGMVPDDAFNTADNRRNGMMKDGDVHT